MSRIADAFAGTAMAVGLALSALFFLPTNLWFDVRSVQVLDTVSGTTPRMVVDRTINMPFLGDWTVAVLRVVDRGFEPVCSADGSTDYDPLNRYPANMDLDWWTWPTQCNLPVGEYVVRTVWTIHVLGIMRKEARSVSNLFHVFPEGGYNVDSSL